MPALRQEALARLPAIRAEAEPCGEIALVKLLTDQWEVFKMPTPGANWQAIWKAYIEALCDVPLSALEIAFQRWHKGECYPNDVGRHAFFPKPAEIFKLASDHAGKLRIAAFRAQKAVEFEDKTGGPWTPERKAAERQKAIEMGILTPDGKFGLDLKKLEDPKPMTLADRNAVREVARQVEQAPTNVVPDGEEYF